MDELILSQSDLLELAEAVKVIERHYPGRQLRLVAKSPENGTHKRELPPPSPPPRPKKKPQYGNNRKRVAEAATGRWLTLEQLMQATGLKKFQVHGAMLARDGEFTYERRLVNEAMPNGPKEYRLKGT